MSELVSAARNSLLAGRMQGIPSNRGLAARQRQQKKASNQSLTTQFSTHQNREFFAALQGIQNGDQGKFRAEQGNTALASFCRRPGDGALTFFSY
jgi:hypothetical protein